MSQRLADQDYRFDPADPRAPSMEQWNRMTPAERVRVVAMLPSEVPLELVPPEGDLHWAAKVDARRTLDAFFHRIGRKIYLSSDRDFGRQGIDAAFDVKTTTMTRSEQKTD
jgi:hypothetical protein